MKQFHNFINGVFVPTSKTFEKRTPISNQVIGLAHEAGQAEVDAADKAAQAQARAAEKAAQAQAQSSAHRASFLMRIHR
jgi:acyl-CoA reductase-like NAD-dependent aldehyde dehydrogenase